MMHRRLLVTLLLGSLGLSLGASDCSTKETKAKLVPLLQSLHPPTRSWRRDARLPGPRRTMDGALAASEGIYVIGGFRDFAREELLSRVDRYDPDEEEWTRLADLPIPRLGTPLEVGDRVYLAGGLELSQGAEINRVSRRLDCYLPDADAWILAATIPVDGVEATPVTAAGLVLLIGTVDADTGTPLWEVLEYDPVEDEWILRPAMPDPAAGADAHVLSNGELVFVLGGGLLQVYDPIARTWASDATLPTLDDDPESSLLTALENGDLVLLDYTTVPFGLEHYQVAEDEWVVAPEPPVASVRQAVGAALERLYVVGGTEVVETENGLGEAGRTSRAAMVWDPVSNLWTTFPDMPNRREQGFLFGADGRAWILGGTLEPFD